MKDGLGFAVLTICFGLVYLKGGGLGDPLDPLLALSGVASFFNGWAVLGYRKKD